MKGARLAVAAGMLSVIIAGLVFVAEPGSFGRAVAYVSREARAAAVFFVTSVTSAEIRNHYASASFGESGAAAQAPVSGRKVKILIVPGHEPGRGGTAFGGVYERNVVVDIADALATLIRQNPHYDVAVARSKTAWDATLKTYFDARASDIETFRQTQVATMQAYLADGSILSAADQVYHNAASSEAALHLYGINKWASDNQYDITLHLHINDEPGHTAWIAGEDTGFAVYIPDYQYSNAAASRAIGEAIATRLNAFHATSTLPREDRGVVEDQQLIALGSNNSADAAAVLIEYGYIYEPQFQTASVRPVAVADYAYQTYLGLQDFFKDAVRTKYGSVAFPYDWSRVTGAQGARGGGCLCTPSSAPRARILSARREEFQRLPGVRCCRNVYTFGHKRLPSRTRADADGNARTGNSRCA